MKKSSFFITSILLLLFFSCEKKESAPINITAEEYHLTVDHLTSVMVHDIFSPPVASRIYAYPNIAAYETLNSKKNSKYKSLQSSLNGLRLIIKTEVDTTKLNYELASLIAYMDISKDLVFSSEMISDFRDSLYIKWTNQNKEEFETSKEYALNVSEFIREWMNEDYYKETRSMPKFTINSDDPSRWQPTPPAYMDGIEPHWNKIRPFVIDSASQFKPSPPPHFSLEKESDFYKELIEVLNVRKDITEKGDESEEIAIAQFWDCNPYVSVTKGHFMFASKKITPGAHWIGICKIACKSTKSNFQKTVYAYTKTSIAIADAFISCWDEKYRSNLIRPETLINKFLDDSWEPILQTPPFPEYTSGHSVVSGSAATTLTSIFGEDFTFEDTTEIPYGLPSRKFSSFNHAAQEAAISRLYGGIHYRSAIDIGLNQGIELGSYINKRIDFE